MRNLKKFLALALAVMMAFSLTAAVGAAGPTDIAGNKYESAIRTLYQYGVVEGVNAAGDFNPNGNFTRAQMAGIAYKIATGDVDDKYSAQNAAYAQQQFTDVPSNHWAAGYIGFCANWGIVKGAGDGTFNPGGRVTGYQVAVLMLNLLGYGKDGEFQGSNWQKNAGELAIRTGISVELGNTSLSAIATRAEVAQVAYKAAFLTNRVQYINGGYAATGERLINEETAAAGEDRWGAPSTTYSATYTWPEYDVTSENEMADQPLLESWTPVSQAAVYKAAGLNESAKTLTVYTNGAATDNKSTVTVSRLVTDTYGQNALGGQGRWTRVYSDRIIYVDTFLTSLYSKTNSVTVGGKEIVPASYSTTTYYNNFVPYDDHHDTAGSNGPSKPIADRGWSSEGGSSDDYPSILGESTSFDMYDVLASYSEVTYSANAYGVFDKYEQITELVDPYKVNALRVTVKAIVKDTAGNPIGIETASGAAYLYNCTFAYNGAPIGPEPLEPSDPDESPAPPDPLTNPFGRLTDTDIGTARTLYLDAQGNILGIMPEPSSTESGYGVVVDYDAGRVRYDKACGILTVQTPTGGKVTLKFIDIANGDTLASAGGAFAGLKAGAPDGEPYGDEKDAVNDAGLLMGHLVHWVTDTDSGNNGYPGYCIISVDDTGGKTAVVDAGKIDIGDAEAVSEVTIKNGGGPGGLLVNNNTVFFVANYQMQNSKGGYVFTGYTAYTGFQNLPRDLAVATSWDVVAGTNPNAAVSDQSTPGGTTLDIEYIEGNGSNNPRGWASHVLIFNGTTASTNRVEPVDKYAFIVNPGAFIKVHDSFYEYSAIMDGKANQAFRVDYNATGDVQKTGLYTYSTYTNDGWSDVKLRESDRMFKGSDGWYYVAGVLYNKIALAADSDKGIAYGDPTDNSQFLAVAQTGVKIYLVNEEDGTFITVGSSYLNYLRRASVYGQSDIWYQLNQYGYIDTIYIVTKNEAAEGTAPDAISSVDIQQPAAANLNTTVGAYLASIKVPDGVTDYAISSVKVEKINKNSGVVWESCAKGESFNTTAYTYRVTIVFVTVGNYSLASTALGSNLSRWSIASQDAGTLVATLII